MVNLLINNLSRRLLLLASAGLVLILQACDGAGGGGGSQQKFKSGDEVLCIDEAKSYCVDWVNGDDETGTGRSDSPVKTISQAVNLANANEGNAKIYVKPGLYNEALGEQFPIILDNSISIEGLGDASEEVILSGSGEHTSTTSITRQVALVVNGSNSISNIQIENSVEVGVLLDSTKEDMVLDGNSVVKNSTGILIEGTGSPIISNNVLSDNGVGLSMFGSDDPRVYSNDINTNSIGIRVGVSSEINLGIKNNGGSNKILGNSQCDLLSESSKDISALGNIWDINEFEFSIQDVCGSGANIATSGSGTVNYQFIPSNTFPLFTSSITIEISSPAFGEKITGNQPNLLWTPSKQPLVVAAILNHPVVLKAGRIANPDKIVWLWHSGLGTANEGDVNFSQGVSIIGGDINKTEPPKALDSGRSYYWYIMAWDTEGKAVTHSSHHNYFTVP